MYSPSSFRISSSGSAASRSSAARAITSAIRVSAFSSATVGRVAQGRLDAGDELRDGELLDAALAERGQHVRDVLHERPVRPDDEHAAARVLLPLGVDQPGGAVEADGRLAGARPALDHERPHRLAGDQAVLVGLDRRDDVAHVRVAAALELLEQEVADAGAVERRPVERLVGDVDEPAPLRAEAAAEGDALRILRRRRVERPRRRRLPVDDDLLALVVVHPAPADVERPLDRLEVEPAEHQPALGVLEGREPLRRPRVERRLRDLAVGRVARAQHDLPHPLEVLVGAVDVRLLGGQIRMAHRPTSLDSDGVRVLARRPGARARRLRPRRRCPSGPPRSRRRSRRTTRELHRAIDAWQAGPRAAGPTPA